jgi:lipopolysaccharide transport system permease protein
MVGIIEGFRWSLLGTGQPDLRAVTIALVLIAAALLSGLIYFRRMERSFADVI